MQLSDVRATMKRLDEQVQRVVLGQSAAVDLLAVALLAEGHVLLEGAPGTAKTLLARTFAASLDLEFKRVQFTPDLMPGDVLGTSLYDFAKGQFALTRGPIFTEVLLADEINRTPPKTQAALLQAMQERAVTLEGTSHPLSPAFMVVATQNPIEMEGTYPLPEAQLDRFLFKILIGYPSRDDERAMVRLHGHRTAMPAIDSLGLERLADRAFLAEARALVAGLTLSEPVSDYIVDLVRATREHPELAHGASPRAANMLAVAARALAVLSGRDYAIPDDVKRLALPLLRHRLVLAPGAELDGSSADAVVRKLLDSVPAPR
ncbi:MAG: MoxR family ATPase [Planctomycetes bacterium]|nr:MoxR family ATPase [Planctomycetota bacterium]